MLTVTEVRQAKPGIKPRKLFDSRGMFLLVTPAGGKLWRLKYRYGGKEKLLALGGFPDVDLASAREARDAARKALASGVDPAEKRKADRRSEAVSRDNTFGALAGKWYGKKSAEWASSTREKTRFYLDRDLLPALGTRPISEIRRPELIDALRRIEERDAFDVAKKCRGWIAAIFKYALAAGVLEINHATDLHVLAAVGRSPRAHAHIGCSELPVFLNALACYGGSPQTAIAIRLHLLTGARPGELRGAPWIEFNLDKAIWSIPAERMKMRRGHVVPLPTQAVQLLRQLHTDTGTGALAFPARDHRDRPMSENTVNVAIGRLGFGRRQTGHGFRHLVSTALNERGYNRDWIERQLAHGDANEIRAVYNSAQYLDQRRQMMQAWADELDRMTFSPRESSAPT